MSDLSLTKILKALVGTSVRCPIYLDHLSERNLGMYRLCGAAVRKLVVHCQTSLMETIASTSIGYTIVCTTTSCLFPN